MNLEITNKTLGRRIQPALWSGKTITPYPYDSKNCLVAAHAISTVYYELPDILNIRGWCMVLIDLDESTDTHLSINDGLYEYIDKKLEHEGVHRVIKDRFHKVPVTKHIANPRMAFHNGDLQISIEHGLDYYTGAAHELKLELIDERPDLFDECTDVLKSEVEQEMDREVLKQMAEEEKRRNGRNTTESTEAPETPETANQYSGIVSAIAIAAAKTDG